MKNVTVRELRNHSADVLARVARGDSLTVARDGEPVAMMRPLSKHPIVVEELIGRRRNLPAVDLVTFRADLDEYLDPELWITTESGDCWTPRRSSTSPA